MYHLKNAKYVDSWLKYDREYDPHPERAANDEVEPGLFLGEGAIRGV